MKKRSVADILKQAREAAGISQQELANRTGLARVYIAMLETGTRENPTLGVLSRISLALGGDFNEPLKRDYLNHKLRKR